MKEKQPQSPGAVATQIATPDWNAFLRILAPQFITRDKDILISKEDDTISFEIETARLKEFQEHFDQVLQSSESLERQLSYQHGSAISSQSSDSSPVEAEISECPCIENLEQAKSFMAKLFGAETMNGKTKLPINFNNFFEKYEKGVLISDLDSLFSPDMVKLGQAFLCAHFNAVNVQTLRKIISQPEPLLHLQAPDKNIVTAKEGEGFVQTCFGFIEDTSQMYFNIGRFLQLIYPPQVHVEEMTESKTRVTISASHLLLYVKQLSRHGILFTVKVEYGMASAHPVLLPQKETIAKPLMVFIVLDDSGSMADNRAELFLRVRELIEKIALVASEANIHLTIFSGEKQQIIRKAKAKEFDYSVFNEPALSGQTALYDAMLAPLDQMKNMLKTHNTMLVVFTDGQNNDGLIKEGRILAKISEIKKAVAQGDMPPEIHAIGDGTVDRRVLNALAQAALHKEYTNLGSFKDLGHILQKIEDFEYSRVIAEFRTTVKGREETHALPICLNGRPNVVRQVIIPLSKDPVKVSFNTPTKGQELALSQVTLQITATQAQETMEEYQKQVKTIYADETTAPIVRIAQLNGVLSEMNTFCTRAPQQIVLALQADLQEKIQTYNKELLGKHDARSPAESSSISRASSPSLGRDSPINAGIINSSPRVEERKVSSPTPR